MADQQTPLTTDAILLGNSFRANSFFTVGVRDTVPALNSITDPVPKLIPNSGFVDVKNKLRWKNYGSTDEVPSIIATEYELEYGTWARNIAALFKIGSDLAGFGTGTSKVDPYIQMYASKKTGFTYNFPWLLKGGDNIRTISSTWAENATSSFLKGIVDVGNTVGGSIGGSMLGATNVGFEQIQEYKQTTPQSLTISFPLYNTGTVGEIFDHYSFVSLFTFQNLKTRTSLMTYIAPKLYSLDSGGIGGVYWPVAYVSELKIDSIGTTRNLRDFAGYTQEGILVPEAYKVTITFKELLPQSSNIFAGSIGGKKIEVTNPLEFFTPTEQQKAKETFANYTPTVGAVKLNPDLTPAQDKVTSPFVENGLGPINQNP